MIFNSNLNKSSSFDRLLFIIFRIVFRVRHLGDSLATSGLTEDAMHGGEAAVYVLVLVAHGREHHVQPLDALHISW